MTGIDINGIMRRNIYKRPSLSMTQRPYTLMRPRPTVALLQRPQMNMRRRSTLSMTPRPYPRSTPQPTRSIPRRTNISMAPTRGAAGAGGLPGGGLSGGLSTSLGGIGGDISTAFGGIVNQAKGFIPTAIKIIAAVVVIKIVLWLVGGRKR